MTLTVVRCIVRAWYCISRVIYSSIASNPYVINNATAIILSSYSFFILYLISLCTFSFSFQRLQRVEVVVVISMVVEAEEVVVAMYSREDVEETVSKDNS